MATEGAGVATTTVAPAAGGSGRACPLTPLDVGAGLVGLLVTAGIVALAIRQQTIPAELGLGLASIIAYYFGRSARA